MPSSQKFKRAPYDLSVIRFPVSGWESHISSKHRASGDHMPQLQLTSYRYYGFRMLLSFTSLDVGSIIKASTYTCQATAQGSQSHRISTRQWLCDRVAVVKDNLRFRSFGFERRVDNFLSDVTYPNDFSPSVQDGETETATEGCFSSRWSRPSVSRPSSIATTCVPASPHIACDSLDALPNSKASRRGYTMESDSPRPGQRRSIARVSWTDTRTLNGSASLSNTIAAS